MANVLEEEGTKRVKDAKQNGQRENVVIGETRLGHVSGDDLANRVCVDQPTEEDEGDQVLGDNDRIEVEVDGDKRPVDEKWNQAKKRFSSTLPASPSGFLDGDHTVDVKISTCSLAMRG